MTIETIGTIIDRYRSTKIRVLSWSCVVVAIVLLQITKRYNYVIHNAVIHLGIIILMISWNSVLNIFTLLCNAQESRFLLRDLL